MSVIHLKEKLAAVEAQMRAKLEEARATFAHSGDKGASLENSFRAFLKEYLPRRLEVGYGEIIDSKGRRSKQTDVVIVNEDHPFTFTPDLPGLFFVEGVCAAGEVKASLTSEGLRNALENSWHFKKLRIEPGEGTIIRTNPSDRDRFYKCPPWFLVAFESQLSLASIRARIEEFIEERAVETNGLVDAVFVLGRGWVINFGDGKGALQFRTLNGVLISGWIHKDSDLVLFDLLGWLSAVMPRMIRFEPILPQYIFPRY